MKDRTKGASDQRQQYFITYLMMQLSYLIFQFSDVLVRIRFIKLPLNFSFFFLFWLKKEPYSNYSRIYYIKKKNLILTVCIFLSWTEAFRRHPALFIWLKLQHVSKEVSSSDQVDPLNTNHNIGRILWRSMKN